MTNIITTEQRLWENARVAITDYAHGDPDDLAAQHRALAAINAWLDAALEEVAQR